MTEEKKTLSRSEREAQIKDKAGWLITVLAALLAINTYISSGNSSKVLNNTIGANNTWAFYQAKSVKQTLAEMARDDAIERKDFEKANKLTAKINRYESEPATGEGKKELMAKAKGLEAERDQIRKSGPWMTFAGSAFQIAIVLLTASILAVSMSLYWGSIVVGAFAALLMSQGLLLLPLVLSYLHLLQVQIHIYQSLQLTCLLCQIGLFQLHHPWPSQQGSV